MPRCGVRKRGPSGLASEKAAAVADEAEEAAVVEAAGTVSNAGGAESEEHECGPQSVVTVKMKLGRFCSSALLHHRIDTMVFDLNRVLGEAYTFANFHVLRLLTQHADSLPARNPLPKMDRNFFYRCLLAVAISKVRASTLGDDIRESIAQFNALRGSEPQVDIRHYGQAIADLSIVMATMANNHLWMNLHARVLRYLRLQHPKLKKHHDAIVKAVISVPKVPLKNVVADAAAQQVATDLRTWLPLPSAAQFATRAHLTLPLYFKVLKATEQAQEERNLQLQQQPPSAQRKQARKLKAFSLLPTKRGFTLSYIPLSSMQLLHLLKHDLKMEAFEGDGRREDARAYWDKYFNLRLVETGSRRFGNRIVTDGVGVSVLVDRPASSTHGALLRTGSPDDAECRVLLSESGVRVAGVDPGMTDVVTVTEVTDVRSATLKYSSAQYYHDAKINYSARRTMRWCAEEEVKAMTDSIPTGDTSDLERMKLHAAAYLQVLEPLLEHRARRGFRKLRFLRYVHRQKAIVKICEVVAPRTAISLVFFGDWRGGPSNPVSRRTSGPLQDIRAALRNQQNVVVREVDEYRTSKVCCACHCELVNMRGTQRRRQPSGETEMVTGRIHKVLHCKNSENSDGGRDGASQRCGTTWNRDPNASRNILLLGVQEVLGGGRPPAFCRRSAINQTRTTLQSASKLSTFDPLQERRMSSLKNTISVIRSTLGLPSTPKAKDTVKSATPLSSETMCRDQAWSTLKYSDLTTAAITQQSTSSPTPSG